LELKHFFLALLVAFIWGINFIAIHYGLIGFPPLFLGALRFGIAAIPAIFFLKRPKAPWHLLIGYGLFTFALQFSFLFTGIHLGFSPGLASLVMQVQVFFSIGLAALFFDDRPSPWKLGGALIAFIGIGIVALHIGGGTSLLGLIFTLLASFSWAIGNMFSKKVRAQSAVALVVWGNLIALPLMLALSLYLEGPSSLYASLQNATRVSAAAVFYLVFLSTHVGYGAWGFLLNIYPTAIIAPFALLVPIFGFLGSAVFLNEPLPIWKVTASFFVIVGLGLILLEKQILTFIKNRAPHK